MILPIVVRIENVDGVGNTAMGTTDVVDLPLGHTGLLLK
jgi:hypothetical protein